MKYPGRGIADLRRKLGLAAYPITLCPASGFCEFIADYTQEERLIRNYFQKIMKAFFAIAVRSQQIYSIRVDLRVSWSICEYNIGRDSGKEPFTISAERGV